MLRMGLRVFSLGSLMMSVAAPLGGSLIAARPTTVELLTVDGTIVPVVVDYIDRAISRQRGMALLSA